MSRSCLDCVSCVVWITAEGRRVGCIAGVWPDVDTKESLLIVVDAAVVCGEYLSFVGE